MGMSKSGVMWMPGSCLRSVYKLMTDPEEKGDDAL